MTITIHLLTVIKCFWLVMLMVVFYAWTMYPKSFMTSSLPRKVVFLGLTLLTAALLFDWIHLKVDFS